MIKTRKKLIEVALPLEAINIASAREKSIRHGHPSTLHLWWARRPLAAARAVIFAQMVDDPSSWPDLFPTEKKQDKERQRLFKIIEDLVLWENTTNEQVLQAARDEIWSSWRRACAENVDNPRAKELFNRNVLPAFHDPFAGGGALPLEAQRLGLESYASDLNPVAVLINKAMIEIPPRFAGKPPVNPDVKKNRDLAGRVWQGAQGLAEDVRYYGQWMRDEAERRIGHLYPKVEITAQMVIERSDLKPYLGRRLTVIAWLWARTVKSPNPAFSEIHVPLTTTFLLGGKKGKEAYVEPLINGNTYEFFVKMGTPTNIEKVKTGTKLSRGSFRCLFSDTPIAYDYINNEANAGRMESRLMAVVAEGPTGRVWLNPTKEIEEIAGLANPTFKPDLQTWGTGGSNALGRRYGFHVFGDYFTRRQLVALTTLSDLVPIAREMATQDAKRRGWSNDPQKIDGSGSGADAYGEAIALYLALLIDQVANHSASVCGWNSTNTQMRSVFARQVIPMTWDYAESNPFSESTGSFSNLFDRQIKGFETLGLGHLGSCSQADALEQELSKDCLISTDPPYYDNIGYADLSDYFYVWLRRSLREIFPTLFSTVATPKANELVALPYRHEGKAEAGAYFLNGMSKVMRRLAEQAHPGFPTTIYYAFKQSETQLDGTASTGWETFLEAVIQAGFSITGTWPVRTEKEGRVVSFENSALASSIVLVCRPRLANAQTATRRDFLNALKSNLPAALTYLQEGNIAPVDLAQAAIGPGMAVYSQYAKVLDAEGQHVSVRAALAMINAEVEDFLSGQDSDFDADTRWALAWFEQMGFDEGDFGLAEQLSKAKNTSISGLIESGIVRSKSGKVQLLKPSELTDEWNPETDRRLTTWESVHRLIQAQTTAGEAGSAAIVSKLGAKAETARELCYRLYTLCERKKRANDALLYNALVQSWPEIARLAQQSPQTAANAGDLFSQE